MLIVEFVILSILIGAGATLLMDIWAAVLKRFGVASLKFAILGRWIGQIPRGRWFHENMASVPPMSGERALGWCAHYAIGITFAGLLLSIEGLAWARAPSVCPALLVGVATVVAPWFVLQPALGLGIASRKTPRPIFNAAKSLVTHIVFGTGLYLAARCVAPIISIGR